MQQVEFKSLVLRHNNQNIPLVILAALSLAEVKNVKFLPNKEQKEVLIITPQAVSLTGEASISKFISRNFPSSGLYGSNSIESSLVSILISTPLFSLFLKNYKKFLIFCFFSPICFCP